MPHISPRNGKSQPKIFPQEIASHINELIQCDMEKNTSDEAPPIYLGGWLELFEMKVGEAAEVAGCDQSYISNIIANREPNVNVLYLLRLSDELGITINDFYRPLPNRSQIAALKNLSPKAQATLLARQQRKS
jgi:plasmid maintenance system antidote protein VapI